MGVRSECDQGSERERGGWGVRVRVLANEKCRIVSSWPMKGFSRTGRKLYYGTGEPPDSCDE